MRIRAVLAAAALAFLPLAASAQQPAVAEGLTAVSALENSPAWLKPG